ncbi:MAG: hypothetical protein BWY83_02236 [bacterium ADurb.Bin478]|nr:MAG: hypothetical protein BWY83_02236 [bacterium ADurb.Bin478]
MQQGISAQAGAGKGLVESHDKIAGEIFGHPAVVGAGKTVHLFLLRPHLNKGALRVSVDRQVGGFRRRKSDAQMSAACGGGHLHFSFVFIQSDGVIIGLTDLAGALERRGPFSPIGLRPTRHGHQGKITIIAHPGAGLMSGLEGIDGGLLIGVDPSVPGFSGLRRPERHGKRSGHSGIGVAVGKTVLRIRTEQWIDSIG